MKCNTVLAMILAMGSLTATAALAQDKPAGSNASTTQGQPAASNPADDDSGSPTTVDADGVPVGKPNPMSDYLEGNREDLGGIRAEVPVVGDSRSDGSKTDGQTK